jgi:16S rRNA (guanine(527)-N(7))-methyltransferase RsmG
MQKDDRQAAEASEGLQELQKRFGVAANSICANQLQSYLILLQKWNRKVNLTSSTSWGALQPFFLEAFEASRLYPHQSTHHLDIGSGAGFPALLMRILIPRMRLVLVESRGKRAAFLKEVCRELGLTSTAVANQRLEECDQLLDSCEPLDCISWKAIKLSERALSVLGNHCGKSAQFWMFHARAVAVENPESLDGHLQLLARHMLVRARSWQLSIYAPKAVASCLTSVAPLPTFHVKQSH